MDMVEGVVFDLLFNGQDVPSNFDIEETDYVAAGYVLEENLPELCEAIQRETGVKIPDEKRNSEQIRYAANLIRLIEVGLNEYMMS